MSMAATKTTAESELLEQGCEGMDESALAEHLARVEVAVQQAIEAIENRMSAGN